MLEPPFDLEFSGPTETVHETIAIDGQWWQQNRNRVAGWLRGVSHGLSTLSGFGLSTASGSAFRAVAGILGLTGAGFIGLFGRKPEDDSKQSPHIETIRQCIGPQNINNLYFAILSVAGSALALSGRMINSGTELASGIYTAVGMALAATLPESPVQSTEGSWFKRRVDAYRQSPKKLVSDLLQGSAIFVLVDAYARGDALRMISGFCLGCSNIAQRRMRNDDYQMSK